MGAVERLRLAWAVLRGRQTWSNGYPTPWAYEQACEALWLHRDRAELAQALLRRVVRTLREVDGPTRRTMLWPLIADCEEVLRRD